MDNQIYERYFTVFPSGKELTCGEKKPTSLRAFVCVRVCLRVCVCVCVRVCVVLSLKLGKVQELSIA